MSIERAIVNVQGFPVPERLLAKYKQLDAEVKAALTPEAYRQFKEAERREVERIVRGRV